MRVDLATTAVKPRPRSHECEPVDRRRSTGSRRVQGPTAGPYRIGLSVLTEVATPLITPFVGGFVVRW